MQIEKCKFLAIVNCMIIFLLNFNSNVKRNPGLKTKSTISFLCCHWNVNKNLTQDKLTSMIAYNVILKYNIICFSLIYLDSKN